jgi:hypothetical protein
MVNRKLLVKAAVVVMALVHGLRVHRGKSLPLSVLSYLGQLTVKSGLVGVVVGDLVGLVLLATAWRTLRRMSQKSLAAHKNDLSDWLYGLGRLIPFVEAQIQAEMNKQEAGIKHSLLPEGYEYLHALPKEGLSEEEIMKLMESMSAKEIAKWQSGRVSGQGHVTIAVFSPFFSPFSFSFFSLFLLFPFFFQNFHLLVLLLSALGLICGMCFSVQAVCTAARTSTCAS